MNARLILFSGMVTAILGAGIGIVAAGLFPTPYSSQPYQDLDRKYALVGGVGGLLIGSCQEMMREAKAEQDEQDDVIQELKRALRSRKS
jgi:hypothetical protein